jgi:hypothetical protein
VNLITSNPAVWIFETITYPVLIEKAKAGWGGWLFQVSLERGLKFLDTQSLSPLEY